VLCSEGYETLCLLTSQKRIHCNKFSKTVEVPRSMHDYCYIACLTVDLINVKLKMLMYTQSSCLFCAVA